MIGTKDLIDIYITTYQRPSLLDACLKSVFKAIDRSAFKHRVVVLSDDTDEPTLQVLRPYLSKIFLISNPLQMGLPFTFNLIHDFSNNLIGRTNKRPKLICYLQDDTVLEYPEVYFTKIMEVSKILPKEKMGFVSGYYTPIHPGFEKIRKDGITIVKSDTIDGKNIIGTPELFESVGKLSWKYWGLKRGNPGKYIGSGFDLWQWRDSPTSTQKQGRTNLIIPGLVKHTGSGKSTWGNESDTEEKTLERVEKGKIYVTSKSYPVVSEAEYFQG